MYFVPTIVAFRRKDRQRTAIFILNLFLGWTLIGWVGALVWAYIRSSAAPLSSAPSA
ncbi:superinfection immunity protein [Caulobacter sp. S45]|uniref:superinfection immunity protein n=1 Tax=Caulobacter sp. S45 TaxID=1641861 RepID=UPI001575B759|nr:superinfection immunity protein [Caulobacter sp. S45]